MVLSKVANTFGGDVGYSSLLFSLGWNFGFPWFESLHFKMVDQCFTRKIVSSFVEFVGRHLRKFIIVDEGPAVGGKTFDDVTGRRLRR